MFLNIKRMDNLFSLQKVLPYHDKKKICGLTAILSKNHSHHFSLDTKSASTYPQRYHGKRANKGWNLSNINHERATFETCYSQCTVTEAEALTLSATPFQAVHE